MSLPEKELDIYFIILFIAAEAAIWRQFALGYDCILGGLQRSTDAERDGAPWGPELTRWYHRALDGYIATYGAPIA